MAMNMMCAVAAAMLITTTAHAQTRWSAVKQSGQPPAARIQMPGVLRGIAVTCDRGRPLMAVRLATPSTARAARGRLMVGAAAYDVALARVGASETWAIPIADPALLGRMAAGGSASLQVTGMPATTFSLAGADAAFAEALASCYTPSATVAARAPASPAGSGMVGALAGADAAAIDRVVRRAYAHDQAPPSVMTPRAEAIAAECVTLQSRYDRKLGENASFGLCSEDADALCACQDMDEAVLKRTLKVTTVVVAPNRARATARFALFGGEPATNAVTFDLLKAPPGWQIDRAGTEQATQLEGIAKMRKALGLPVWTPPPMR